MFLTDVNCTNSTKRDCSHFLQFTGLNGKGMSKTKFYLLTQLASLNRIIEKNRRFLLSTIWKSKQYH